MGELGAAAPPSPTLPHSGALSGTKTDNSQNINKENERKHKKYCVMTNPGQKTFG